MSNWKKSIVLFIIAVLVSFGVNQIIIQYNLNDQQYFSHVINQAGRQRMLSQKFAKLCNQFYIEKRDSSSFSRVYHHRNAKATLDELKTSQLNLIAANNRKIQDAVIDSLLQTNLLLLNELNQTFQQLLGQQPPQEVRLQLKKISSLETSFLSTMEKTVDSYEDLSESHIYWLSFLQIAMTIIWIISIITIFLYTVYPTIQLLKEKNYKLSELNSEILTTEEELRGNLEHLSKVQDSSEREQHLNKIFISQAPNAIAMFDTEMCYLSASGRWLSDYGLEGKEIIGLSHYEIFPEIGADWKSIHRAALNGVVNKNEGAIFKREDGSIQWINWDVRPWYLSEGEVGGVIILTNDITEKKNAELEKRKIQNILDVSSRLANIGTWEVDLLKQEVYWSELTRAIHEVPEDFTPNLKEGIDFYKKGESREAIQLAIKNAIEKGDSFDLELQLVSYSGKVKWVKVYGLAEIVDGTCTKIFGAFQDIDNEVLYKKSLEEAKANLQKLTHHLTSKNKQLADFAQITSHNLRAPVSNLNMLVNLYKGAGSMEEQQEIFNKIETVTKLLSESLNTLVDALKVSETKVLELQHIDFNEVLARVKNSISAQLLESEVEIEADFSELESIKYNSIYMESIIQNLLSNAVKYRSDKRNLKVELRTFIENGKKGLIIKDNGLGIDLNRHGHKIFKLNKTFHRHKDAKGIGLFMTKTQIVALGGDISVESAVEEGTAFKIIF